jgi:GT2 family glycosyltransferase
VIHFLDDDIEVEPDYFEALERELERCPDLAGVGGVFTNALHVRMRWAKRLFLLDGGAPGRVFPSGRPVHGQFVAGPAIGDAQWLSGGSMTWRMKTLESQRFNEDLANRAMTEDLQFSFAVGRVGRLRVVPAARCLHREAEVSGRDQRVLGRERFDVLRAWVARNRKNGLSLTAFWWSVFGEIALYGLSGLIANDRAAGRRALGVLDGIAGFLGAAGKPAAPNGPVRAADECV